MPLDKRGKPPQQSAGERYNISGPIAGPGETTDQPDIETQPGTGSLEDTRRLSPQSEFNPILRPKSDDLHRPAFSRTSTLNLDSDKDLPATPGTDFPPIPPLSFSINPFLDQSGQTSSDLPPYRDTAAGRSKRTSSVYPGITSLDIDEKGRNTARGYSREGLKLFEEITLNPHTKSPLSIERSPEKKSSQEDLVTINLGSSTLEEPRALKAMAGKSSDQTVSKWDLMRYCALCIVVALIAFSVVLSSLSIAKCVSMEKQLEGMMKSETLSSSSTLPLMESPAPVRVTSSDLPPEVGSTGVVIGTSLFKTSDTPSLIPTSTSALETSSILSPSSRSSSSPQSSIFIQGTMVDDALVRRSGHLGLHEDSSSCGQAMDLDAPLTQREDPEDCADTTITSTTTLTTTITSTIRKSRPVTSGVTGNSESSQPPESEAAETVLGCIKNTVFHTDGLPISATSSYELTIFDTESSFGTTDSEPSPDMTHSPTMTSNTQPLGADTTIISVSSSAQARRLAPPPVWKVLRPLRRFWPLASGREDETQQNRRLLPSLMVMPTVTTTDNNGDNSDTTRLLSTTSSNAAARRRAHHWTMMTKPTPALSSRLQKRDGAPSASSSPLATDVKWTYWQAYTQVQLQLEQLCYSVKDVLNTTTTSAEIQMGEMLNKNVCNSIKQEFPRISEGEKCDRGDNWESLVTKVEGLCDMTGKGEMLVQSVRLLCETKESIETDVEHCDGGSDGDGDRISSQGTGIESSVLAASRKPSPGGSMTKSPIDSSLAGSEAPSIPVQANAVVNTHSVSGFVATSSTLLSNSLATLSKNTVTGVLDPTMTTSATNSLLPSSMMSPPAPGSCPDDVPQLSYPFKAAWSTPVLTSFTEPPSISTWGPVSARLTGHSVGLVVPIPCGYTSSHVDNLSVPNIVVPTTSQIGELSFYDDGDAFSQQPACQNGMLQQGEAIAAIGWSLYDWGRGGSPNQVENALCGRKIIASCAGNGEVGFDRKEVELWVRDRCAACRPMDLDVLKDVFKFCANPEVGRAAVTWRWAEDGESVSPTSG